MTKGRALVLAGALAFVTAWFLPVIEGGATLGDGMLPGWQAFRVAVSLVWPDGGTSHDPWYGGVVPLASGLTNFVMIAALLSAIPRRSTPQRWLRPALFVSALLNSYWFVFTEDRGDFRIGYYLWTIAFVLIAIGLPAGEKSGSTPRAA